MVYLDNAATTKLDPEVLDAMLPYLKNEYGNASSSHKLGQQARQAISVARRQVASILGCDEEQIIFTSGASESNSLIILGILKYLRLVDRKGIITTAGEHDSILMFESILKQQGFDFSICNINKRGVISSSDLNRLLNIHKSTGLVSVMHINNELGGINKINLLANICHNQGALFHTDASQSLGYLKLNCDENGVDFLTASAHKVHGPKGVGCLFVKDSSKLSRIIQGSISQEFGLRGGTENVAAIVGFGKACSIAQKEIDNNEYYIYNLKLKFWEKLLATAEGVGLKKIFHLNGNIKDCGKILNFRVDGIDNSTLLLMLSNHNVMASSASACQARSMAHSHVLLASGLSDAQAANSIRISFSKYNSFPEIDTTVNVIIACVSILIEANLQA